MTEDVMTHYGGVNALADAIVESLRKAGVDLAELKTSDLSTVDEFHIRGRKATLELAEQMNLGEQAHVLDIGSGLGGPARTLAEAYGCHVTGIDLTREFCEAAEALSKWIDLSDRVTFKQGDATNLPFDDDQFDAAMTIHVAMNIPDKNKLYVEARRVLKPGGVFAAYDVLQGEGGDVLFPVPWAREPSISHVVTQEKMESLLTDAEFQIVNTHDSTDESQNWFEARTARMSQSGPPLVTLSQVIFGDDFREMARNQVRNLTERRIRTVTYICKK